MLSLPSMWVSGQYKICYLHNVSEQPIVEQAIAKVKRSAWFLSGMQLLSGLSAFGSNFDLRTFFGLLCRANFRFCLCAKI